MRGAHIAYSGGQPLAGGLVSAYIYDAVPGIPQQTGSPTIQQSGNVISIYYQIPYQAGPATSITLHPEFGPLDAGDYKINYYATTYLSGGPVSDSSLRDTFNLTVLPGGEMRRTYEYYYAAKDHYFVTSDANEIQALDSGRFPGWVRTGQQFWSFTLDFPPVPPAPPSTLSPVCRFYGLPSAGLDSHFFTSSPSECTYVQVHWHYAWQLESQTAFLVVPVDSYTGFCPPNTFSVYRLYNNRPDINHRYTISSNTRDMMVAQGWIFEGIVWCSNVEP
ncbi:MAG: hypothetical protein ABI886_13230 [Betaproteobacteria bacterium]